MSKLINIILPIFLIAEWIIHKVSLICVHRYHHQGQIYENYGIILPISFN